MLMMYLVMVKLIAHLLVAIILISSKIHKVRTSDH